MPLYEYVCKDCDTKFDALVRSRESADTMSCAECASDNVRRLVSTVAMVGGLDDPLLARGPSAGGGCCGGSCGCGH